MDRDTLRKELTGLAPVNFDEWYKNHDSGAVEDAVDELDAIAQWATRLATYLEHRVIGGGHEGAVKASNRAVTQVRKALGYSYPKQDLFF